MPNLFSEANTLALFLFVQYKGELVREFTERIVPQFANGKLRTVVDSVFPMDQVQLAHQRMESNENIGKIIIQVTTQEDENVDEIKSEL